MGSTSWADLITVGPGWGFKWEAVAGFRRTDFIILRASAHDQTGFHTPLLNRLMMIVQVSPLPLGPPQPTPVVTTSFGRFRTLAM